MNIKVLIDFETLKDNKENHIEFNENLDTLKKIINLYDTSIIIRRKNINFFNSLNINNENMSIYIEEEIKDKEALLKEFSEKYDWVLYFKNTTSVTQINNIVYSPINLKQDISQFKNKSFTEHARHKKYYHDFSNYYMYTLANDTEKEGEFLIKIFNKYLNKTTGKVLDCCCGVGRHAYIMGKNGFKVIGIDFSQDQIENARKIHNLDNIEYKIMDTRYIDLEEKDFDMSYCMWTTYNYLSLDEDFRKFIISNYNHQKRGGLLILDSKNIPRLEYHRLYNRYTEKENFKMEILINKYVYNNIQNSNYFLFINDNGINKFFFDDEFVRFYTTKELKNIISGYYELVDIYGDFDMNLYDERNSNRFIPVLKRL